MTLAFLADSRLKPRRDVWLKLAFSGILGHPDPPAESLVLTHIFCSRQVE
jgi:hypothetical protein